MRRLLAATPSEGRWRVYVLQIPDWNAMASPGNNIYVFTGLLDDVPDDEEIAAILAHEIGHRLAQHHLQSGEEVLGQILAGLAGVAVQAGMENKRINPDDARIVAGVAANVTAGFVFNPYSHRKELEADQIGLFLMADAGFNPQKAARVWLKQEQKNPGHNAFFDTHPSDRERYQLVAERMPEAEARYRRALQSRSKGGSRAAAHVPARAARAPFASGSQRYREYRFAEALPYLQQAVSLDPQFVEARLLLGTAQVKVGDLQSAARVFQETAKVAPQNGVAVYNLACVRAMAGEREVALAELAKAVRLDPALKQAARDDGDLFALRNDGRFKSLVSGGSAAVGQATVEVNVP